MNIFYSWQSDLSNKSNRYFIEDCLKRAIKKTNKRLELSFVLDRDTKGAKGSPDITHVIFDKIDTSVLFIADVTLINPEEDSRPTPNPNVLIELGYAAARIGWENIICVFNLSFGSKVEDLPFDIRSRRILAYSLAEGESKAKAREQLTSIFTQVFENFDLAKLEKLKKIKKRFKYEDPAILEIALNEGKDWEFELFAKLLENRLALIKFEYSKFKRGLKVIEQINCSNKEFLRKSIDFHSDNLHVINVIAKIINNEITKAIGEPGVPGNQILIIETIDNIYEALLRLLEVEINLSKFRVRHPTLVRLKESMLGIVKEVIIPIEEILLQFEKVYLGYFEENEHVQISLTFKTPHSYEGISEILAEISNNPRDYQD